MLILQNISYSHPNKDLLFSDINLIVNNYQKIALIGNNGTGKSTLLKIIAGELKTENGHISINALPYYIPQIFKQFNDLTIAEALKIDNKLNALKAILNGSVTEENYMLLDDDWTIEERCNKALQFWQLTGLDLSQKMETLSEGQKTKVFLSGISIHQPELILLDEPSNHLDNAGRQLLYDFIQLAKDTLIVVSHDRKLLNFLDTVFELNKQGIKVYGGNYNFYKEQKQIENNSLNLAIQSQAKALRKAKEKERETIERQQKLDSRGKARQDKAGVAKIMMNTLRNNAENSTSKLKGVHAEKIDGIAQGLQVLHSLVPHINKMKFGFNDSVLYKGKILLTVKNIHFAYNAVSLWKDGLNFQIITGERVGLKGRNGSGKTTLIKLILGEIEPQAGTIYRSYNTAIYIDQDYSLLQNNLKVYEQVEKFNVAALHEHEIKIRLNRFLFFKEDWDKPCNVLSGGERMRLSLCCLTMNSKSPDIIILDEPTNNLDIQNVDILTTAINEYQGTLIVVSHDETFLKEINIERTINL